MIKIASYNCCSIKKNIDIVRELANSNIDIIFLQETFITDTDLGLLDYIHDEYESIGVGATFSDKSLASMSGRPMGGLACIWNRNKLFDIRVLQMSDNYIVLKLTYGKIEIILVNVYLRSNLGTPDSKADYLNAIGELEELLNDYN